MPTPRRTTCGFDAAMAENKTKPTDASIEDYIASRANEQQRADCRELMALLEMITQQSPRMWGPSIVGYGSYRYTYDSGRTGEAPLAGFAIRAVSWWCTWIAKEAGRRPCWPSSASTG